MEPKLDLPPAELPQPEVSSSGQSEVLTPSLETQISAKAPTPPPAAVPMIDPAQPAASTTAVPTSTPAPTGHLVADDGDLIEKEWVTKAKAIVAQTKSDPYVQNQEVTRVKADYLKKRYNKDLKLGET